MLTFLTTSRSGADYRPDQPHIRFEALDLPSCLAQDELQQSVEAAISQSRPCRSDEQCIIRHHGCPFGCSTSINSDFEAAVQLSVKEYQDFVDTRHCPRCTYRCMGGDLVGVCNKGLCTYEQVVVPEGVRPGA